MLGYGDAGRELHRTPACRREVLQRAARGARLRPRRPAGRGEREPLGAAVHARRRSITPARTGPSRRRSRTSCRRPPETRRACASSSTRSSCWPTPRPRGWSGAGRARRLLHLPPRRLAARASSTCSSTRCVPAAHDDQEGGSARAASTSAPTAGWRTCAPSRASSTPVRAADRPGQGLRPGGRPAADARRDERRLHPRAVAQPRRHRGGAAQRLPGQRDAGHAGRVGGQPVARSGCAARSASSTGIRNGQSLGALLGLPLRARPARPATPWPRSTASSSRCARRSRSRPTSSPRRRPTRASSIEASRRAT